VADTFLGNLAGVVVQVVEGAEDVRVVTDEVVGELVDQREVLPAATGRGRIGNIWEGVLEEHPVTGAQLGGGNLLERADSDADGLQEAAGILGRCGALVAAERPGEWRVGLLIPLRAGTRSR
jgi:hypothetical protein